MTVVAFMRESEDSLLLAADQQATRDGIRTLHPKLRQVKNQQIAWSSAGNPSIGLDEFSMWINAYRFKRKDWSVFVKDATAQLSQLNGKRREMAELSGVEYKPEEMGATVLIVGWLADKPGAFLLTNNGSPFNVLQHDFEAIGIGGKSAFVARTAIRMCQEGLDGWTLLKFVMESVAEHVEGCLRPIDIWRIEKDFIDKASQPMKKSES